MHNFSQEHLYSICKRRNEIEFINRVRALVRTSEGSPEKCARTPAAFVSKSSPILSFVTVKSNFETISHQDLPCPKFGLPNCWPLQTNPSIASLFSARCLCQLDCPIGVLNQSHHPEQSQREHGESQGELIALHSLPAKVFLRLGRESAKSDYLIATLSKQPSRWLRSADYEFIIMIIIIARKPIPLKWTLFQDPVFI